MADLDSKAVWPGWKTVRLIGRGSYGAVYEIERQVFDRTEKAALKVISIPQNPADIEELVYSGYDNASITETFKSHLKSIVNEYSLMKEMNGSSYIVSCDDFRYVEHDDGMGWDIFIRMELLTPLFKALNVNAPEEQVIELAKDMCRALALCRKHNIIHRDIKPQNIFYSPNGDYKLGDFGIAKTIEKNRGGTKIGTYRYMAPEVYNNQPYSFAADIYSLGLVLHWLLNERRSPFMPLPPQPAAASMEEEGRLRRLNGEPIPTPAHGSEALKAIVLKACAYDPGDRYQTAEEMLDDLEKLGDPSFAVKSGSKPKSSAGIAKSAATAAAIDSSSDDMTMGSFPGSGAGISGFTSEDGTTGPFSRHDTEAAMPSGDEDGTIGLFDDAPGQNKKASDKKAAAKAAKDKAAEEAERKRALEESERKRAEYLAKKNASDEAKKKQANPDEKIVGILKQATDQKAKQSKTQAASVGVLKQAADAKTKTVTQNKAPKEASADQLKQAVQASVARKKRTPYIIIIGILAVVLVIYFAFFRTSVVPYMTKYSRSDAEKRLQEQGYKYYTFYNVESSTIPKGLVVRTSPPYGTKYRINKTVTVYLSSGPGSARVPYLSGKTSAEAEEALEKAGFKAQISEVNSTIKIGNVVNQDPAGGQLATKGSVVKVSISKGPGVYTVYFDANGGTVSETRREVVEYSSIGALPTPKRTGYTFTGWYTVLGDESLEYTHIYSTSKIGAGDVTVYAHWKINSYSLYFDANGGKVSETSRRLNYNTSYGTLPTPTRTGYTFDGWYTAKDGGNRVYSTAKMADKSITVYAHWTKK